MESLPKRNASIFTALRYRDFRLLWIGLMVSNLGTWMQFTAMGFFVAQVSRTPHAAALNLGYLGAARAIPVLLLSPLAGVVADRFPRRRVLMITNVTMALVALALALLASGNRLEMIGLVALSAVNSAANAFDAPTRQSWVPMLVDRQFLGNAVGLNSVAFNAPAVAGPALAGALIVWVGVAGSFYINAVLTLAVVVAVLMMRPSPPSAGGREPLLQSMQQGIRFIAGHPILKWFMLAFLVAAIFARPYAQLVPAFVVNVLHAGPHGLGWAVSAIGVGGFAGALITAQFAQRERRSRLWLQSGLAMSCGVAVLGFVPTIGIALPVLAIVGLGTMALLGATNTILQMLSPDDVRGRALAVYTMIAIGVVPGGSLVDGAIAAAFGLHAMFVFAGTLCAALFLAIWFFRPAVRSV
ncbi:MAG: MFS transporter [Candidatus Eremiobacteraeota bacterium]|nr:MFS transporter [Candidatus Eremiobacteraeota bacterium]MBV8582522.1 MFS transporter [Candidatus Eremiobacteraeota bacterium]